MLLPSNQEAILLAELKANGRGAQLKAVMAEMLTLAKKEAAAGKDGKAGLYYAALAHFSGKNQNLPMRAARSYHKAGQSHDAARWYLEAAERYALMHQVTQAIVNLRLYQEVAPDEYNGPKRIFDICREQDSAVSGLYEFLSIKDKAIHALRSEGLFALLDDKRFDATINAMLGHHLKKGDVLTRAGDKAASLFIVIQGGLEGFLMLDDKHIAVASFAQGDMCSLMPYYKGSCRMLDVVAVEPTDVLELPFKMLNLLSKKVPPFAKQLEAVYRSHLLTARLALAPVFGLLDVSVRRELVPQMQMQRFKAGEMIFHEGDASSDVYLLCSGAVAINMDINQQEQLYKIVKAGALIGEISVAIKGRRSHTARAISDCLMAKLSGDIYSRLFDAHEVLRLELGERKKAQLDDMHAYVRGLKLVDSDEAFQALLKVLWGQSRH